MILLCDELWWNAVYFFGVLSFSLFLLVKLTVSLGVYKQTTLLSKKYWPFLTQDWSKYFLYFEMLSPS